MKVCKRLKGLYNKFKMLYFVTFAEGNFQYFDYGSKENIVRYGQENPPQYQLQNISTPIALFYAQNDWLAGPEV